MMQSWSDAANNSSNWKSSLTTAPSSKYNTPTMQRDAVWLGDGSNVHNATRNNASQYGRPTVIQTSTRDSKIYDAARGGGFSAIPSVHYGRGDVLNFDSTKSAVTPTRRDWGTGSMRSAKKMGSSISDVYGNLLQEIFSSDAHQNEQESLAEQLAQELGLYDASKGLESEQERSIREREAYIK
jgi:hypothetical protein